MVSQVFPRISFFLQWKCGTGYPHDTNELATSDLVALRSSVARHREALSFFLARHREALSLSLSLSLSIPLPSPASEANKGNGSIEQKEGLAEQILESCRRRHLDD